MDDLIPFIVFIVIALINFVKFLIEKGAKDRARPAEEETAPEPAETRPNTLEDFFENLARKMEPEPVDVPEWFPAEEQEPEPVAEAAYEPPPPPPPSPEPAPAHQETRETADHAPVPSVAPITMKAAPNAFAGIQIPRVPTTPMLRAGSAGVDFSLRDKKKLRAAILANVVFSAPRAFDAEFDNTIAK